MRLTFHLLREHGTVFGDPARLVLVRLGESLALVDRLLCEQVILRRLGMSDGESVVQLFEFA